MSSGQYRMSNPVSKTAYYCAGVRMLDARSSAPLVNDRWAEQFMGEEGRATFELFEKFRNPNGSNIARHYVIDQIARRQLATDQNALMVLVGAGFDARAFRLPGGRWLEVDEAAVIDRKETIAPSAECPNALQRIAIDFSSQSLADVLASHASDAPTLVIVEGVLTYLDDTKIRAMFAALAQCFPQHRLVCDVMSRRFVERYSKSIRSVINSLGADFTWLVDNPLAHIEAMGYRVIERSSVALRASELRTIPLPRWLIAHVLRSLRDGYQIALFEHAGGKNA